MSIIFRGQAMLKGEQDVEKWEIGGTEGKGSQTKSDKEG